MELSYPKVKRKANGEYLIEFTLKLKRNRIVPVPEFIREQLSVGKKENNIFTNTPIEFNEDYFKTLWGCSKRVSRLIEQETLYFFFTQEL